MDKENYMEEIKRLESENVKLKEFYDLVKSYYTDLDSLVKRLQDDYAGDEPFDQLEEDRIGLCLILDTIDDLSEDEATEKRVPHYGNIEQAITEFAEKLKEKADILDDPNGKVCWDAVKVLDIDETLKEFLKQ